MASRRAIDMCSGFVRMPIVEATLRRSTMSTATTAPPASKPKLFDQVRLALRSRHYSRRAEQSYVHWIRRFILFHGKARYNGRLQADQAVSRWRVVRQGRPVKGSSHGNLISPSWPILEGGSHEALKRLDQLCVRVVRAVL